MSSLKSTRGSMVEVDTQTKTCIGCKETKPIESFNFENKAENRRCKYCKVCSKKWTGAYHERNREKVVERTREFRRNNPENKMVWTARGRAKRAGLICTITPDDIHIPEYCPYLGLKLHTSGGKPRGDETASLDRIDPTKGYIPGNVEVISDLANRMKNSASKEQQISFALEILKRYGNNI